VVAIVAGAIAAVLLPWRGPPNELEARLTAARTFTSDPALEVAPRFSPDGRFVAFTLGEGVRSRIVVQSIADSSRRFVGDGADLRMGPVFFPDGKRIAYWRRANEDCAIVEHDLGSGAERPLLDCALAPRARFDLAPDGRRIAFSGNSHPQSGQRLWLAELGGAPVPLTTPEPGQGEDAFPRFSPDGSQVAFLRGNASHARVWIVEVGGARTARPAGNAEGLGYGMAWLGTKGPLLVAADWFGFRALNLLDPATGEARLLGARGARFPDVGPGGAVVWENAVYSSNLWLHEGAGAPKPLWTSTRYTSQAEFSPDGTQVAFASNRDGTDAVYVAPLGGEPRRIAFGDTYRYMRPHWSADGRWVHAVRIDLGPRGTKAQHAVRIPLDGGAAETLAIPAGVNDVRESRDGRWLYWGALAGEAMQLWRAPVADPAKAERLALPAMSHYQMNAERVVFAQPQLAKLTGCRLADLACAPLDVELGPGDLYHWALGPRSLYVRVREGQGFAVARIDLATGRRVATLAAIPGGSGASIAVPPDESALLIAREEGPAVDLMLAR
jgi:Tol biopolymer transport system component